MDEHENKPDDSFFDAWSRLSSIERECVQNIETEDDHLQILQEQREVALERLWVIFQAAASSLAQLYKERPSCDCCERCIYRHNNHDRSWQPFQGAANKVTSLYRDGSESLRAGIELGYHAGFQKRNRDITNWVKKKRRTIRREDILLNLSGRSPPRKKISDSNRTNSISPKPATPESDFSSDHVKDIEAFHAFVEGRNPFSEGGRKRHSDINMLESPHKRGRFS